MYLLARFPLLDEERRSFATAGLATDVTERERAVADEGEPFDAALVGWRTPRADWPAW